MAKARAIVITGNGTNCEVEAAHACRLGGFDETVIVHISDLLSGDIRLDDFHFINLTGGFLVSGLVSSQPHFSVEDFHVAAHTVGISHLFLCQRTNNNRGTSGRFSGGN